MSREFEKPGVIDLFCGCGGLSLGFIQAGYHVILGVDNDAAALETFRANHPGSVGVNLDLAKDSVGEDLKTYVNGHSVDVIIGGPPCQGFSLTGPRNLNDDRNKLYMAMHRSVKAFRPSAFVIENVKGIATLYKGQVKEDIITAFDELGYNVSSKLLCAADYGVPQMRQRYLFVGIRKDIGEWSFPEPTHTPETYVSCEEAISDLPSREKELGKEADVYTADPVSEYQKMMRGDCCVLRNHTATRHTDKVKHVISLVPEGGNYKDLPPGVGESRKFNEAWTRYHSKKPSRTIDTGHRNHFHYKWNRVPTIRENARLQSFPDDFVFLGTKTQQNRQVGNAVPPRLAYHVAMQIKKIISNGKA